MKKSNSKKQYIPLGTPSYLKRWMLRSHINLNIGINSASEGWQRLAHYILLETIFCAAQTDQPTLSQEAQLWLCSPAGKKMFDLCGLKHADVKKWISGGCSLPESIPPQSIQPVIWGVQDGRIALDEKQRMRFSMLDQDYELKQED